LWNCIPRSAAVWLTRSRLVYVSHQAASRRLTNSQAHRDTHEALKAVQHELSEKQQETLKRLEGQSETLSYACSRIDKTRDLHNSGDQHSQALDTRLRALEQAIAELPSKEDSKVQAQALQNAIAIDLQLLAKEEALSYACSRADEILDAQRGLSNNSHSQRSQIDEISKHVSATLSRTEAVESQLSSISVTVSDVRHAQTNGDASLASSLHLSDIGVSNEETTRALRSLEEQVHQLIASRRDDVVTKELGSIGAAIVRLEHSLKNHEDHDTIGGHLKAIEQAIAALPSKEDNKVQAQALHSTIAVDLQPLAKEGAVSYACGRADEILDVQRNNAIQSQFQQTRLEEVLSSISSLVARTESIEFQLHSVRDTIAELRRVHDVASSTHLSNVSTSSQETARTLHSLEQQIHKLAVARHEDATIKELGSIAAALVRLERSLKNHDSHDTIGSHLEAIEHAIATLPSKEDNTTQAQALHNAIVINLKPLAKEEALDYACSRADELLKAHQETASQSQTLRKEIQELAERLNSLLARTEAIDPQLHSISNAVDEIRRSEHLDERSLKPSIDVSDINVASRDTTMALRALEEQVNKLVQLHQSDSISQELTALATVIARVEGSLSRDGNILQSLVNHKDMSSTHQDSLKTHLERMANQLVSLSQKADTHDGRFDTIQVTIADIRKQEKADSSAALAGVAAKLEEIVQATHRGAQEGTLENIATQLGSVAHATTQGVSRIEAVERFVKETYEKEELKETLKEIITLHHGSQGHWRSLFESIEKVKEQVSGLDIKVDEQSSAVNGVNGVVQKLTETQLTEDSLSSVTETLDHISSRCYEIVQQTHDDATTLGAIVTKIDAIHTLTGEAWESAEILAALKELEAQVLALNKGSATVESTGQLDTIHTALSELSVLIAGIKADMATSGAIEGLKMDVQDVRTQTSSIIEATSDLDAVVRSSDSSSTVVGVLQQKLDIFSSQLESAITNLRDGNAESTRLQEILASVQAIQSHASSGSYEARFENLTRLSETIVQNSAALDEQITTLGAKVEIETAKINDLEGNLITKIGELQQLHPKVAELCDISNQLAKREHLDGHFAEFNKSLTTLSDLASRVGLLTAVKDQTQHIADKIDNLAGDMTTLVSQVEEIDVAPLHIGLKDVAAQVEGSLRPTMEKMDELTQLSKSLQENQDKVVQAVDSHIQGASVAFERIHTDSDRALGAVKHLEELFQTAFPQDRDSAFISQLKVLESQLVAMSSTVAKEEHLSALHELLVLVQQVHGQVATSATVSEILTLCQASSEKLEVVRADISSFKAKDPPPAVTHNEIVAFSAKLDHLASEQQAIKESAANWKELLALYQESSQHTSAVQTQMSSITERIVTLPTKADTERTLQEIIQILSRLQERDTSLLQSASRLAELVGLHGVSNEQQLTVLSQLNTLKESISQLVTKSSETDTKVTEEVIVRLQELLSRTEVLSHTTSRLDTLVQLSQESISHYQLLEKRVETVTTHVNASVSDSNPGWEGLSVGVSNLRSDLAQVSIKPRLFVSIVSH
jgi:chromosome segregation ATPase